MPLIDRVPSRARQRDRERRVESALAADDEVRDEPGPPGLVRSTETCAVVAVEVLVEEGVVPARVLLEALRPAEHRSRALRCLLEDGDEPPPDLRRNLLEIHHHPTSRRALHLVIEALERYYLYLGHSTVKSSPR